MNKRILVLGLAICLALSGCGKSSEDTSSTDIESVELTDSQEIVTGKITEIYGNEITYTVAEETDASSMMNGRGNKMNQQSESQSGSDTQSGEKSDGSSSSGESMPQGSGIPDTGDAPSGDSMPQGSGAPDMGDAPSGESVPQGSGTDKFSGDGKSESTDNNSSSDESENVIYTLTDESNTMTIPVGTSVITSLGNKTTFSRLSTGDLIKMIIDTDGNKVIIGVWMI